jgi:hypothetical protein
VVIKFGFEYFIAEKEVPESKTLYYRDDVESLRHVFGHVIFFIVLNVLSWKNVSEWDSFILRMHCLNITITSSSNHLHLVSRLRMHGALLS